MVRFLLLLLLLVFPGCSEDSDGPEPGPCVDATRFYAMPTPDWQSDDLITPPDGDRAARLLSEVRPSWFEQLASVDGWPLRPTVVIPLAGLPEAVDSSRIAAFGAPAGGAEVRELETGFEARIESDGLYLVVKPEDPFPAGISEVILVVATDALEGGQALPACGPDGGPHPAYAQARERLPAGVDVQLALPFRLATTWLQLSRLWERIENSPVLSVEQVEALSLDSLGDQAPPPEVAVLLGDPAARGILALPDYRGAPGYATLDADGAPLEAGTTRPGFIVALPATGSPPYPWVLFQHGGSQDKVDLFQLAGPLAEQGFALVGFDLPFHGDRAGSGGGSDMAVLNFENPLATRDNLRQASADHLALFAGIEQLNQALQPVLGTGAAVLDPERAFYMGLSLGGITGSMTFAAGPRVKAAALFVGAGGYPEMVSFGLFGLLFNDVLQRDQLEIDVVLGLGELLLDGADPLAYGRRSEDLQSSPRPAVFMQAVDDPIIDMPASDRWARSFGADLARPNHHPVPGMDELDLPAADNFSGEDGVQKATRLLVHCPMNEIQIGDRHEGLIVQEYSQRLVAHCFRTFLDTGSCQVMDTGFHQH